MSNVKVQVSNGSFITDVGDGSGRVKYPKGSVITVPVEILKRFPGHLKQFVEPVEPVEPATAPAAAASAIKSKGKAKG